MIVKRIILLFSISLAALFAESSEIPTIQAADYLIAALEGRDAPESLLPYLMEIALNGHNLPAEQRQQLEQLRFDFSRKYVTRLRPGLDNYLDFGQFRIHYDTTGDHAISTADSSGVIGIPDYVETVAAAFQRTYFVEVDSMQFTRPPNDANTSSSDHFDVYIQNLGQYYYALTYPDEFVGDNDNSSVTEVNAWTSYMEIRNNYSGFSNTEEENIQVTAAHEFFHSIQFGYDGWDYGNWEPNELWLLEGTAVLMEEIVFDDVNDCYQYMPSWFSRPYLSLDLESSHVYGSFIFFQYIYEHLGGYETIRRIFEWSIIHDSYLHDYSHLEITEALEPVNSSFQDALNKMVAANLIMSNDAGIYSYEEADSYPVQGLLPIEATINYLAGDTLSVYNYRLNRFASQYFAVNTFSPILVSLTNQSGPASDLNLLAILETSNGNYKVLSGNMLNIPNDYFSINLAVVSQDTLGNNWDFKLFFQPGAPGNFIIPDDFEIALAYPNPFDPTLDQMTIEIISRFTQSMAVNIFNITGRNIISLKNNPIEFGKTRLIWNGRTSANFPAASGTYIIVATGDQTTKSKLIT
ncbi:MAG: T9SS type A sorting domain-containing protein, partial [Candidatus Marinimicrobia bacterium]|nr:T9SS type A sorting domain-containing protein [Candidatus Neomarinimicrobiota bacterium]